MEKLGVFIPTRTNLEQIFNNYDANGNGVLDYVEFTAVFTGKKGASRGRDVYSTASHPTSAARGFSPPKTAVPKPAQD